MIPDSSLTGAVGQRTPGLLPAPPNFPLLGKTAMKLATQIAEEWTVGPVVASHLTTGGSQSLVQPFFESALRFQHITPFLTDIDDVREPFFLEFTAIVETDVQGGEQIVASEDFEREFKDAFARRRPTKKMMEQDQGTTPEEVARGLFQRFIERRRNVRGDRMGKPLSKFVETWVVNFAEKRDEPGAWRLERNEPSKKVTEDCYFFSRPGAKELFREVFRAPTIQGRMAVTITQFAMLDASAMMHGAGRSEKSRGIEGKVVALATEMAEAIASLEGHPCQCCWTVD